MLCVWKAVNYIYGENCKKKVCKMVLRLLQSRSQWPRGLQPLVCLDFGLESHREDGCVCWVLSGRCFCDELNTRPEESYRLWCVVVCDLETSWIRRSWPTASCRAENKQTLLQLIKVVTNVSYMNHNSTDGNQMFSLSCRCQSVWWGYKYSNSTSEAALLTLLNILDGSINKGTVPEKLNF
jgi:hypothetical protein